MMTATHEELLTRVQEVCDDADLLQLAARTSLDRAGMLILTRAAERQQKRVQPLVLELLGSEERFPNPSALYLTMSRLYNAQHQILKTHQRVAAASGESQEIIACLGSLAAESMQQASGYYRAAEASVG